MNTERRVFIGCDPGMDGAIVVISDQAEIIEAHNMPVFKVQVPKKAKKPRKKNPDAPPPKKPKKEKEFSEERHVDFVGIQKIMSSYSGLGMKPEIYVEHITHLFGLPSSSNFKLGYAAGVLHGAIQSVVDEFYLIGSKKWHQILIPSDMEFKENGKVDWAGTAKNAFARLFPNYKGPLNSEGIRDAALIAYAGLSGVC